MFNERAQIRQGIRYYACKPVYLKTNKEAIAGIPKQMSRTEYLLGQQLQQLELTTRAMHRGGGVKLKIHRELIRLMNQLQQMAILGLKENRLTQAVEKDGKPRAGSGTKKTRIQHYGLMASVTNSAEVNPGDLIRTTLPEFEVISIVNPSSYLTHHERAD